MRNKIFELIASSSGTISGAAIGVALGVSRVAINKHVQALVAMGIKIECSTHTGYKYIAGDTLCDMTLRHRLHNRSIGVSVVDADSTNNWAKSHSADTLGDTLVVAARQSGGKGRMGRKFISDVGGVYMTYVKCFDNLMITDSLNIVLLTGLAVARVLSKYGLKPAIKWPNDIYVEGKKISGILLESSCSEGKIDKLYLGIGININNTIASELDDIAVNLQTLLGGVIVPREDIIAGVASEVDALIAGYLKKGQVSFIKEYLALSMTVGREVRVESGGNPVHGMAVGLSKLGYLTVSVNGVNKDIVAGDVFPVNVD